MSKHNRNTVTKTEAEVTNEVVKPVQTTEPAPVEAPTQAPVQTVVVQPAIQGTAAELIKTHGNKSTAIRFLNKQGHKTSAIAKALEIRYQHVRNVLNQPLKREIKAERDNSTAVAE